MMICLRQHEGSEFPIVQQKFANCEQTIVAEFACTDIDVLDLQAKASSGGRYQPFKQRDDALVSKVLVGNVNRMHHSQCLDCLSNSKST